MTILPLAASSVIISALETFPVCDPCYALLAQRVWIVPGPVTVRCDECDGFMNPRELAVRRALVKEVYRGTCRACVGV
ncbi:hypothetical protein GBA63_14870 [Rubrobacter tropicus]|uniref:Uncharacterized protein n=1 Tax=Rubrobacter tropicus TaxID=2653851 RepID=A0A6G8QBG1_9ACTN|nr:hypothetical protein [Rubrobacter tropicus]QIN83773.1 hypothetical protein GBA63_14870 [Rubrobacter tropicus]